jgi:uncharacterized protein related to proFAR isomerase
MRQDVIVSPKVLFSGISVEISDVCASYENIMSSLPEGAPVLFVDADGLRRRDIVPDILRKLRSKRESWLMTGVRNPGDLMDAFHGNISRIVVPYHLTSDAHLTDMIELSDCCMPALFTENGEVHTAGKMKDLMNTVGTLRDIGFVKMIVLDVSDDGRLDEYGRLRDHCDALIPYVRSGKKDDHEYLRNLGFDDILAPVHHDPL